MKSKLFLIFAIALFGLDTAAQKSELIGYEHKGVVFGETLPNGARDLGGGLLSNDNYGVSRYVKDKRHYLWLEKIDERDTEGVPVWVVKDVLEFSALKRNQEFLFSYSSTCKIEGRENLDVIVLAAAGAKNKRYKVLKAWKANLQTERFEPLRTRGIRCQYEKR